MNMNTNTDALTTITQGYNSIEDQITQTDFTYLSCNDIGTLLNLLDDKNFRQAVEVAAKRHGII